MPESNTQASAAHQVTLGCFEVGGRAIAIDVSQVREIVRWQPLTPFPNAPELIEGVVDLRDAVVPVIDLGRALGGDPVEASTGARIVVTEVDGLVVGLLVEAAIEVLQIDVSSLEDPPALVTHAGYAAARGVFRRPDQEPLIVLSLEHILESVYRSALSTKEDAA